MLAYKFMGVFPLVHVILKLIANNYLIVVLISIMAVIHESSFFNFLYPIKKLKHQTKHLSC